MLFDTGAAISVMGYEEYRKLSPKGVISQEEICVRQFDGSEMTVMGRVKIGDVFSGELIVLDLWIMDRRVETVLGWDWITKIGPEYNFWGVFARWGVFVPIDSEGREVIMKTVMDEWEEIEPEGMAVWREGRDNIEMDEGYSLYWGESEGITVKDSIDAVREYLMLGKMEEGS
ncbi:unnamed protein product [Gordionus sp. m RMFG-2023]